MPFIAGGQETPDVVAQGRVTHYSRAAILKYDLGSDFQSGSPNGLIADDLRRTLSLASFLFPSQQSGWLNIATNALWRGVPSGALLADPSAKRYTRTRTAGFALFSTFYGAGRKVGRVSKVLHLKRPNFFPILDDRVVTLYKRCLATPQNDLLAVPLYWDRIRTDLLNPTNRLALVDLRAWITGQARADPWYNNLLQLTDLRLFDIAACWYQSVQQSAA